MPLKRKASARSLNDSFDLFVGIDQTGASVDQGRAAKPMPVAVALKTSDSIELRLTGENELPLRIDGFSKEGIEAALSAAGIDRKRASSSRTAILVDCVFGLAEPIWDEVSSSRSADLWQLFGKAAADRQGRQGFGLFAAAEYFDEILRRSALSLAGSYPVRRCEILAGANSVFRTRPYQKNIQCGTYRIWRDLGRASERWAQIRYFTHASEVCKNKPWVFEGYPSLIWRQFLALRTRDLGCLLSSLEAAVPGIEISRRDRELISKSPDIADSAVLAVGGYLLQTSGKLFESAPSRESWLRKEGWIVGLNAGAES